MSYYFHCECGNRVDVNPGQAGGRQQCACGRICQVPSLLDLRQDDKQSPTAPVAAIHASPAEVVDAEATHGLPACPFCGLAMQPGAIYGDRYRLKWQPADEKLMLGIWASGGHAIGEKKLIGRANVRGHRCHGCSKIIVDG